VVVTDKKRRVLVLTKQKSGRRHDKRLADKEDIFKQIPKEIVVMVDTGFQGVDKDHKRLLIPPRKNLKAES
jgi:hypothetical protein